MGNKKWVVQIHDRDGIHKRNHSSMGGAITYLVNQIGEPVNRQEIEKRLQESWSYSRVDKWGRTIEIIYGNVGICKVCKAKNELLIGVIISPKWHKVPENYRLGVCVNCLDDFETGGWTVEYKKGKYKVKQLDRY